jgi:hypothetical protein
MPAKLQDLKSYILFKDQLTALNSQLRQLRPRIIELLEKMPDKRVELSGKTICLMTKQRMTFDMKAAKAKIEKLMRPFFKLKKYSEITILGEIDEEGEDE